jgi:hypothetical protein
MILTETLVMIPQKTAVKLQNQVRILFLLPPLQSRIYAKQFPDVTKIEVFGGQNFRRWHGRVLSILDMYGVASALSEPRPPSTAPQNITDKWAQANKVCRHTILSTLYCSLTICSMSIALTMKQRQYGIQ